MKIIKSSTASTRALIWTSVITLFIVLPVLVFIGGNSEKEDVGEVEVKNVKKEIPALLEPGSTHEHMTFLLFINGEPINFLDEKYMLKDERAHFEDQNAVVIHKHAFGVTLPYFLSTLGFNLTDNCISVDTGRQYCSSNLTGNELSIIVNGGYMTNIESYELRHGDKILVNYGDDDEFMLKLKFNSVPSLPTDLL